MAFVSWQGKRIHLHLMVSFESLSRLPHKFSFVANTAIAWLLRFPSMAQAKSGHLEAQTL